MTGRVIVSRCAICDHEFAKLFDAAEMNTHLAEAHGLYFDPRPLGRAHG